MLQSKGFGKTEPKLLVYHIEWIKNKVTSRAWM